MITAEHLQEAKAYIDEQTALTGYHPGTPEWLEHMLGEIGEVESFGLQEVAEELERGKPSPRQAVIAGALVMGLAGRFADRDGGA